MVRGPINSGRRAEGAAYSVEFLLVMLGALSLLLPVAEIYRLSLFDQALARATHEGARAAAADPIACGAAVTAAFNGNSLARWLFDLNGDGTIGVAAQPASADLWPAGSATDEAHITVVADENLFDGVDWEVAGCGASGSDGWIQVRSRIVVDPWAAPLRLVWPDGFRRQQQSWARNQT